MIKSAVVLADEAVNDGILDEDPELLYDAK
jgi:hypothetical protein